MIDALVITASAALVYAPAVVKAVNLMPLRGIILTIDRNYFGYVDRLYIHSHLPRNCTIAKQWAVVS